MSQAATTQYVPDDETQKIYAAFKAEAEKRQLASLDNFDKSILSYSSAGLALSLTFLKDFVPIHKASATWVLYGSWMLFVVATCLTILSFLVSNKVQDLAISDAGKYYLEGNDAYLDKTRWQNRYVAYSNGLAGFSFVIALAFSTAFVWVNIDVRKDVSVPKDASQQLIQIVNETVQSSQPTPLKSHAPSRRKPKTEVPIEPPKTENSTCLCKVPNE